MDSLEQQITQLKQQHKQGYLGTWAFDQSAVDLDDLLDVMFEAHEDDIKFRSTLEMYEIHRLQKYEWAPPYLLRLLEQAKNTSLLKGADIVAFVSETSGNGYGWHDDLFDILVTNVCGTSTWEFEDGTEQLMKPFDVMFVPKGVRHQVTGHSPRFTAAIGCNYVG